MADLTSQFHAEFIKQIGLGVNISRTYPKGHPSLMPIVQKVKIMLKEVPMEKESLSMVIIEDVIMIDEDRFESKRLPIVKSLVDRFGQLDVKSITFSVDVSDDQLREFFAVMAATPADLADYGDIVAMMKTKGVLGIKVNKFRVGVVSSEQEVREINWDNFLESLVTVDTAISDEERVKQLGGFLAGVGVLGAEPANLQTDKVIGGLEKLSAIIADQYGEGRWDEYSLVFSRILSFLSPTIKKNIAMHKTENKKLAALFKTLIPTMADEDLVDIISAKARSKSGDTETEIVEILKNVTGTRLPDILSTLRVNVPELNFEKIVSRLMSELKTTKGTKEADKFQSRNIEMELRRIFPQLRDPSHEARIKAVDEMMKFTPKLFEQKNHELVQTIVDRLDTMADAESEMKTFDRVVEALKSIYLKAGQLKSNDLVQLVSKKFGKHLMRKEATLMDKKKKVIGVITELKDQNYVPEMVSLLWDQGSFVEAREALVAMAELSVPILVDTLREAEDRTVRLKIIDVLIRIGEKTISEVSKLLNSAEWFIRRNGVFILGELKLERVVGVIGPMIEDPDERVQADVIEALQQYKTDITIEYFKKGLNSKYPRIVIAAMKNLDRVTVRQKLHTALSWLKQRRSIPDEKEEKFRQEILHVLGKVGDDSVIDAVADVLAERAIFKSELLYATKEAALNALASLNTEKARQFLQAAARHKDVFIASSAQDILKKSGVDYS